VWVNLPVSYCNIDDTKYLLQLVMSQLADAENEVIRKLDAPGHCGELLKMAKEVGVATLHPLNLFNQVLLALFQWFKYL